jgi:hypothetical protein
MKYFVTLRNFGCVSMKMSTTEFMTVNIRFALPAGSWCSLALKTGTKISMEHIAFVFRIELNISLQDCRRHNPEDHNL